MAPNLLTQVALTIGSRQGENVATAALVHILGTSAPALSAAIGHLNSGADLDLPAGLSFRSQLGQRAGGIADAVAIDMDGLERVIIEAKIDAGFHGDQLSAYVKRLGAVAARPCLLEILAPESRCASLWRHALEDLSLSDAFKGRAPRTVLTPDGVTVSITSWDDLLDAIAQAATDALVRSELEQLRGLFTYLARSAVLPIDSDDVSRQRGQLNLSIWQIAEHSVDALMRSPRPSARVYSSRSKGGGFWGAGAYLVLGDVGTWFGVHLPLWSSSAEAETPYWLMFKDWDAARGERLANDLRTHEAILTAHPRLTENDVVAGLMPPIAADESAAVDRLVKQLESIGHLLKARGEPAPTPSLDPSASPPPP